jgi:RNA polymerase-binding transcription factor DksA
MDPDFAADREALLRMRAEAVARAAALEQDLRDLFEATRSSNADDEHDPEGATIAFERAQLAATLDAVRRHADDLAVAVRRVDDGTYGVCERCARPIPAQRLVARPSASTCVDCARRP